MVNFPNYAIALRCIGQVLENQNIDVFELKTAADEFHVQSAHPDPPHTRLIESRFLPDKIQILDREGQARRNQSTTEIRFDSLPELLRTVGEYIDHKRVHLKRLNNCGLSDQNDLAMEYQTRSGDIWSETLSTRFLHDTAVQMYKRRNSISNPVSMLTRSR